MNKNQYFFGENFPIGFQFGYFINSGSLLPFQMAATCVDFSIPSNKWKIHFNFSFLHWKFPIPIPLHWIPKYEKKTKKFIYYFGPAMFGVWKIVSTQMVQKILHHFHLCSFPVLLFNHLSSDLFLLACWQINLAKDKMYHNRSKTHQITINHYHYYGLLVPRISLFPFFIWYLSYIDLARCQ